MSFLLGAYMPSWRIQALVADTMFSWDSITPLGRPIGVFLKGASLEKQMVAIVSGEGGTGSLWLSEPNFSTSENLTIFNPRESASSPKSLCPRNCLNGGSLRVVFTSEASSSEITSVLPFQIFYFQAVS